MAVKMAMGSSGSFSNNNSSDRKKDTKYHLTKSKGYIFSRFKL